MGHENLWDDLKGTCDQFLASIKLYWTNIIPFVSNMYYVITIYMYVFDRIDIVTI